MMAAFSFVPGNAFNDLLDSDFYKKNEESLTSLTKYFEGHLDRRN